MGWGSCLDGRWPVLCQFEFVRVRTTLALPAQWLWACPTRRSGAGHDHGQRRPGPIGQRQRPGGQQVGPADFALVKSPSTPDKAGKPAGCREEDFACGGFAQGEETGGRGCRPAIACLPAARTARQFSAGIGECVKLHFLKKRP